MAERKETRKVTAKNDRPISKPGQLDDGETKGGKMCAYRSAVPDHYLIQCEDRKLRYSMATTGLGLS